MNIRIIDQGLSPGTSFQQFLLDLLRDESLVRCTALIAFVTYDGLLRLGAEQDGALQNIFVSDKELHWIIGADSVTTADALTALKNLEEMSGDRCSVRVLVDPTRGLFHPKLFIFERVDGSGVVLIGSNNVTPGGLENNVEVAVLLEELSNQEMESWREIWRRASSLGSVLRPITDDLIAQVREERRRQRGARRRRLRVVEENEPLLLQGNPRILLRYIAGAGGRTSQVHFSRRIVEEFFSLRPGDVRTITIQMVQPGHSAGRLEVNRRLVFSETNRNPKIEMAGVRDLLPQDYPSGWYAIILIQEIERDRYRYMVLLPADSGYDEVHDYLDQIPRRGLAMQESIINLSGMLDIWSDYPV
ncbi:phospholipase D family protein [Chloroflexota bacterium]